MNLNKTEKYSIIVLTVQKTRAVLLGKLGRGIWTNKVLYVNKFNPKS